MAALALTAAHVQHDIARATEPVFGAVNRGTGPLPLAALASLLGAWAERVSTVGHVVLEAVGGGAVHGLLPHFALSGVVGPLAEGPLRPRDGSVQFMLGEFIAELGVLARKPGEGLLQGVALRADLGRLAELVGQVRSLREECLLLAFVCLQSA